jgi:hypothetical protein
MTECGDNAPPSRVPDAVRHAVTLRRAKEATPIAVAQAPPPAHREEALRCVWGTTIVEGLAWARILAACSPELCFASSPCPLMKEGAGKTGCRLAPTVHCAKVALRKAAQRHTGEAKQPAFPAQRFYGLCRALPGERCTIAPVASQMRGPGRAATSPQDLTHRPRASGRHGFAVRESAPVVCATPSLTVARPAKPFAPVCPASAAARPAFVTIAIRPSSLGRSEATHTSFPNFGKLEYF